MTDKFKVGTQVKVTREAIREYRELLFDSYAVNGVLDSQYISDILMWAMADIYPPSGVVVHGTPAFPEQDVRVLLSNKFGIHECYMWKDHLLKKKARKS